MEIPRVPAARFDPKPPRFAARASELHTLQCWELTWKCSYVQVDFSWKNDAWSFAVFPGWCCQWVLTRSRNSCRPPRDFTHRPRCLPQLCFTPAQQRLWGFRGPHTCPLLRITLIMVFSCSQMVGCSPWGWELFKHLRFMSFRVVFPPGAAALRFCGLFILKAI